MRIIAIAAAAGLIGSPALGADKKKKDPAEKIICIEMQGVGSHIPDRVCKTQAEWDQEKNDAHYDIDHLGGKLNTPSRGGLAPNQSGSPGG